MSTPEYLKEQEFWDSRVDESYSVLSRYDLERFRTWVDWGGGGSVLDLGGGSGAAVRVLELDNSTLITSLDISYNLLKHSPFQKVQGNALQLPFKSNCFDLIIAAAFFHHLPEREEELLSECHRVLKKGGKLVGFDPNGYCIQNNIFMRGGPFRLGVFSPDERPIKPTDLKDKAVRSGFQHFQFNYYSMRYEKLSAFEFIQRYLLNPFARGYLKRRLHRWFYWCTYKI